jgi:homoserine kinase type II
MYAGGPHAAHELLDGYLSAGPVPREELEATLLTMLRFRYAVQADYFAYQLSAGDGGADEAASWIGLHDARDALAELAIEIPDL